MGVGYNFKKYEYLFNDDLLEDSLELLNKRRNKMANWLKENSDYDKCKECDSENLDYKYNGVECNDCSHFFEQKVPYPGQGGVVASRKLESIIKELFSIKMAEARKDEKMDKKTLDSLPFDVSDFDTGEFTQSELDFLEKRFQRYIDETNSTRGVDEFYIRSLVLQELKIMKLTRKEFNDFEVKSQDKKREYDVYNKLASKVKASRDARDNDSEHTVLEQLGQEAENIEEELEEYLNSFEEKEEKLKKSKKRREEVGNRF